MGSLHRPRQRRAEGVGRVDRGEHRDLGDRRRLPKRAKPINCPGHGELRAAETGDEVAASHPAAVFEQFEHRIEPGEASGHPLGLDGFAGQHPVAFEERDGEGVGAFGGDRTSGSNLALLRNEPLAGGVGLTLAVGRDTKLAGDERPAALGLRGTENAQRCESKSSGASGGGSDG